MVAKPLVDATAKIARPAYHDRLCGPCVVGGEGKDNSLDTQARRVVGLAQAHPLRVVWGSDEDGFDARNIKAATFSLYSPTDLLQQLIDKVAELDLRRGIANSLNAKLENAQAALAAAQSADSSSACGMLSAFIHEVQAQSGKAITTQDATQLINLANQVRAGLACP